jgi:hypothetical protein
VFLKASSFFDRVTIYEEELFDALVVNKAVIIGDGLGQS